MTVTIVLHKHMRELRYCNTGARAFFARHGLSWPDFLARGIEAEKLERTGDAMALRVVAHAKGERHGRQQ